MTNTKRLIPFNFKRLEYVYKLRGYNSLADFRENNLITTYKEHKDEDERKKRSFSDAPSLKVLYKYKRLGKIHPKYLDMICSKECLDVFPDYILGIYNVKRDSPEASWFQKLAFDQDGYIIPPYNWKELGERHIARHKKQIEMLYQYLLSLASDDGPLIIYSTNQDDIGDYYEYNKEEVYEFLATNDDFLAFMTKQINAYVNEHNFFGKEEAGEAYFEISE